MLENSSIDGFIMALSTETQMKGDYNHLKEVTEQGIPLVLFDRVTNEINCDKVIINDREAAYAAVKKLIGNKRKKIALVTTKNYFNVSRERAEGYRQALRDHNVPIDENLILELSDMEIDEVAIEAFFKAQEIDAVLCVNEIFPIHCMKLVQQKGLKVPEDIAVIGFTDGLLSKYATPTLTSIDQRGEEMGEIAARMLIEKVESEDEEETYTTEILEAILIERESTIN